MTVCVMPTGYIWMEPLEEDVNACQMHRLIILFGWWMGCANVWFWRLFHNAKGVVERPGFNSPMEQFF